MSTADLSPSGPMTLPRKVGPFRPKRLVVALILIALALAPGSLGGLTRELMVDAYIAVSAFVAATLLLFYGAEKLFNFDIATALNSRRRAQVPLAALLGATPGCGGAVIVVAAYSSGHVSFGAVVAALTATMGDAAFLLIATRPDAALVLLPLSFAIGILSGWIIDRIGAPEFRADTSAQCELAPRIGQIRARDWIFLSLALPGLVFGVSDLANVDLDAVFGDGLVMAVALAGTLTGLFIWSTSKLTAMTNQTDPAVTRMAEETSFISVWVIGAFLAYDYAVAYGGLDLEAWFAAAMPLLPLMGNAISNDGDALFPAIALNPRAAIWATLYSAVPALIVAYGFFFLAPGFMN